MKFFMNSTFFDIRPPNRLMLARYFILLFLFVALPFGIQLSASDAANQMIRNINVVLSYHIHIDGKKNCRFRLTSLIPQPIANRQNVAVTRFTPAPVRIFSDSENKYASWEFKGETIKKVISIQMEVTLFQQMLSMENDHKTDKTGQDSKYLRQEKYINVNSPVIKSAENQIKHVPDNVGQIKNILKFVETNMEPGKAAFDMLGAEQALMDGKGDCTEYTDVFVAICRRFKLPAKHISGYILTKNGFIAHSWAEVFSRELGWIYVDPLHMDQKIVNFDKLDNKYFEFSSVRNDSNLGKQMLYTWNVRNAKRAGVVPGLSIVHDPPPKSH